MVTETAPLDGNATRTVRRPWIAPLTVLVGVMAIAASGRMLMSAPAPAALPIERDAAVTLIGPPGTGEGGEASATTSIDAPSTAATGTPPSIEAWPDAGVGPISRWAWTQIEPPTLVPDPSPDASAGEAPRTAMHVPLPVPRPPEFRAPGGSGVARGRSERRMARREVPSSPAPSPPSDERSFLEKLFGVERSPALAYAALETKPADLAPQRRISPPLIPSRELGPTAGVAVYNIITRTVTLPSGERLEAHSGLGEGMDDPRFVNVRMRGPTPPGTYDLTEREQLFHGVRAIRLTPVGGAEAIYGRVGLLAHTFMLGPRGDSNGCVSFRDYERFLQAYLRGEVQRLVVVSGTQDALPSLADGGGGTRMARNGG